MSHWVDQIEETLLGGSGGGWSGSVDELLYSGERVVHRTEIGDNEVVVTSHRILAFTPDSDGENFHQVDRPNVSNVRRGATGETNLLSQGTKVGGIAIVLLLAGQFISLDSYVAGMDFDSGAAGRMGLGGIMSMMNSMMNFIANLDEYMTMLGALLVLLAVFIFAVYVLTRDRVLVIGVSGDGENVQVPGPKEEIKAAATDLDGVLFGSGPQRASADDGVPGGDGDADQDADAGFKSDDPL
jgi:hypothetical protein